MPNLHLLRIGDDDPLVRLSLAVSGSTLSSASPPDAPMRVVPMEPDLFTKLKVPEVVTPRPGRPPRTTISIDSSNNMVGDKLAAANGVGVSKKTMKEVAAEVEHDGRPVIASDGHNRVLLMNDAYKVMVGQPVCPWLDALPGASASRCINGTVVLNVQTFRLTSRLPNARGAFLCTARISWECDDAMASLTLLCAIERLTAAQEKGLSSMYME
ncbi:hypothetical protein EJB05_53670, partial [Eragrostis curvula]